MRSIAISCNKPRLWHVPAVGCALIFPIFVSNLDKSDRFLDFSSFLAQTEARRNHDPCKKGCGPIGLWTSRDQCITSAQETDVLIHTVYVIIICHPISTYLHSVIEDVHVRTLCLGSMCSHGAMAAKGLLRWKNVLKPELCKALRGEAISMLQEAMPVG